MLMDDLIQASILEVTFPILQRESTTGPPIKLQEETIDFSTLYYMDVSSLLQRSTTVPSRSVCPLLCKTIDLLILI